jgi:hypothetical protein
VTGNKEHDANISERNVGQDDSLPYDAPLPRLLLLVVLVLANGLLLAPAGSSLRIAGALALLLLPGLAWAEYLLPTSDPLTRWTVGAGLSYALAMVLGLILHYLPGPIPLWAELVAFDVLILVPGLKVRDWRLEARGCPSRLPGPLARTGRRAGRERLRAARRGFPARWPGQVAARAGRGWGLPVPASRPAGQDRSPRGPGKAGGWGMGAGFWLSFSWPPSSALPAWATANSRATKRWP